MPETSHHWVRLTDEQLAFILDPPEHIDNDEYIDIAQDYIEAGLETW